ncbi:dTMP kinase [Chitinibacteraceae bacterium HSL-7]
MTARFITVEGVDGAGKSTQLAWLAGWLSRSGIDFVQTREPGGTPLGEALRTLLLNEAMSLDTEAMLMWAARREHVENVVRPALAAGRWVLCDRYSDATYAYQGGGRGMPVARIAELERWALVDAPTPDLTLLFDVPLAVAQARMSATRELDRFERETADFHTRVRDAYLARAKAEPARIRVIDASVTPAEIQSALERMLPEWLA